MRKLIFVTLFAGSLAALSVTLYLMLTIYHHDMDVSGGGAAKLFDHPKRVVVISQEQGSYVMNEMQKGASEAAAVHGIMIDFWGVYRSNVEELLKQIDIAIASKVDGIIIEGVAQPEFERMVSKATERGIPVITINADAPGSLRKTYIGSDHYQEGILMGRHLVMQLHGQGAVGVITNAEASDTDQLRLNGLREALAQDKTAGIQLVFASGDAAKQQAAVQAYDIMNHAPALKAFIGLPADSGKSIVQAVDSRSRRMDCQVFMFDDSPQTEALIHARLVQAGLSQHYEEMGAMSIELLQRWLNSDRLPLNPSYYTPISIVVPTRAKETSP